MPRRRREINIPDTLAKYKRRIEALPAQDFQELEGSYLTTFDVFSTVSDSPSSIQSHALVLMEVARAKNIHVKATKGGSADGSSSGLILDPSTMLMVTERK